MSVDLVKEVESLIKKAASTEKAEDAMRFSQAACNAANAMYTVSQVQEPKAST
jgi:hypothetical protein